MRNPFSKTNRKHFGRQMYAIILSMIVALITIALISKQPVLAFALFIFGAFTSLTNIGGMLSIATILIVTGLCSFVGFKAGAFNMGAEGQMFLGALFSALIAIALADVLPPAIVMAAAMLGGIAVGAVWVLIPAMLKVTLGINEIVTTLMSTNIATLLTSYLVNTFFRNPASGAPETVRLPRSVRFPQFMPPSKLNFGIIIAVAVLLLIYLYYYRTKSGLRIRMVGMNPMFAQTVGIHDKKILFGSMLTSGAFAGLAGALVTLGIEFRFIQDFSPGYGMLGITIALIGGLHPVGVLIAAIFYGSLMYGGTLMQMNTDVPFALVFLLQGIIIMLITSHNLKMPSLKMPPFIKKSKRAGEIQC